MPRALWYLLLVLVALSLVPVAWLAKQRVSDDRSPRVQVVPDMDNQPRYQAQGASPFFEDGRAMRSPVAGTVAQQDLLASPYGDGREGEGFVREIPVERTPVLLQRGRERFDIYCSPCHGHGGRGDGLVSRRAAQLGEGSWTPPTDLTGDVVAAREAGHLFQTITAGIRNMPAYGAQIPMEDRWAIVAYVRALQRSVRGSLDDVPEDVRPTLE